MSSELEAIFTIIHHSLSIRIWYDMNGNWSQEARIRAKESCAKRVTDYWQSLQSLKNFTFTYQDMVERICLDVNVNAVEVLDGTGTGIVYYPEWP